MGNLGTLIAYGALVLGSLFAAAWLGDIIEERWGGVKEERKRGSLGCISAIAIWLVLVFVLAEPLSRLADGVPILN